MRRLVLLCLSLPLLQLTLPTVTIAADTSEPDAHLRWAVGWDSGLGARYNFNDRWGLGWSVNPRFENDDDDGLRTDERLSTSGAANESLEISDAERDTKGVSTTLMLFRESRLSKWVGVGPFARVGYSYTRYKQGRSWDRQEVAGPRESTRVSVDRTRTSTSRVWLDLGLRPVFHFDDRLVLETSFGVTVRRSTTERTWETLERTTSESGSVSIRASSNTDNSTDWNFNEFGRELGFGSSMTFMIYF